VLIGADRVVHQVQQDDADESSESNSSNNMSVSIPNDENVITTDTEADQPDQSRIWSTSTSDVPGTLESYINTHADSSEHVPLLVVAHSMLKHLIKGHKEGEESLSNHSNKSISYYLNFSANYLAAAMSRWRNEPMGRTQNPTGQNRKNQLQIACKY
jgi:hypothetical protein